MKAGLSEAALGGRENFRPPVGLQLDVGAAHDRCAVR
jgi:hypothetical protein